MDAFAPRTLAELWDRPATDGAAPALLAPARAPLSHDALREGIRAMAAFLRAHGLGRGDRVASVLPSGPEAALAFLGTATVCAYAPLNPAYREQELDFALTDIGPKALLVPAGGVAAARAVAAARGIPLIEVRPDPAGGAGSFTLSTTQLPEGGEAGPEPPERGDLALLLHTSGTTSRPKLVPVTQGQVLASMANVQASLALGPADRCLSFMPVFHLTGLITAVLASLGAGGSAVCIPEFSKAGFFPWLEAFRPTWYTAVPAIHQAIVEEGAAMAPGSATSLRLVRSSAAPLPPAVMAGLLRLFGVPVIEAFGMTETHQIASNPLPPLPAKPGSVGLPTGPEVAVTAEDGSRLPAGATGEILVRGPNVFHGYEGQPEANAAAFRDGWFRTGDLGHVDADGYLFLTGRVKELINRGGQKVSPREVEAALLAHPAVREAVAFSMPHDSLGEAVAALVVPAPGQAPGEQALRRFLAERLAPFKVPQRILRVPEIPKGATGKVQRGTLAGRYQEALKQGAAAEAEPGLDGATPAEWAEAEALEAALLRHPAVVRCAVLPKHDAQGKLHLAAFLVLQEDASPEELLNFVLKEAPACILPSAFEALDVMPRTAEGRVDHRALAALPLVLQQARQPRETAELLLAGLWEEILKTGPVALTDDFFLLGGDSLKAVELLMRIEADLGVGLAPESLFHNATLGALVEAVEARGFAASASALVAVQPGGPETPFFFVHGDFNGGGFQCLKLARRLGPERAFHTFHPHGLPGQPFPSSIEAMADHYLPLLRAAQPEGPYLLGGHCNGALVAFEMARRLRAAGSEVAALILVSPPRAELLGHPLPGTSAVSPGVDIRKQTTLMRRALLVELYTRAVCAYAPTAYPGCFHVLATAEDRGQGSAALGWEGLGEPVRTVLLPGEHLTIFGEHLDALAAAIQALLPRRLSGDGAG